MRALLVVAACLVVPALADAHFKLVAPQATLQQNAAGDPQKTPPCGGTGTATNAVTTVQTGGMLTVTIDETIFHPGHYRIAIAQTAAGLPAEPAVTGANCGQAAIDLNPAMPVLADGVLVHTSAFGGQQTAQIQLPAGFTCNNCVLQVLEFMSNHAAPCFYYHCATVNITSDPIAGDAGTEPSGDAGGCCDAGSSSPAGALLGLAVLALLVRRRR